MIANWKVCLKKSSMQKQGVKHASLPLKKLYCQRTIHLSRHLLVKQIRAQRGLSVCPPSPCTWFRAQIFVQMSSFVYHLHNRLDLHSTGEQQAASFQLHQSWNIYKAKYENKPFSTLFFILINFHKRRRLTSFGANFSKQLVSRHSSFKDETIPLRLQLSKQKDNKDTLKSILSIKWDWEFHFRIFVNN